MNIARHLVFGVALAAIFYAASLYSSGDRRIGVIESIHGIPYPRNAGAIVIEEQLAHTDVFLQEPVLGKMLTSTVTFDPGTAQTIDMGVREGAFWLGYTKLPLYKKGIDIRELQTKTLVFPLSTMFQETDRSIDMMFFADRDDVSWKIHSMQASTTTVMPSRSDIILYIRSVLSRERAL